jgi:hypothetical protein
MHHAIKLYGPNLNTSDPKASGHDFEAHTPECKCHKPKGLMGYRANATGFAVVTKRDLILDVFGDQIHDGDPEEDYYNEIHFCPALTGVPFRSDEEDTPVVEPEATPTATAAQRVGRGILPPEAAAKVAERVPYMGKQGVTDQLVALATTSMTEGRKDEAAIIFRAVAEILEARK